MSLRRSQRKIDDDARACNREAEARNAAVAAANKAAAARTIALYNAQLGQPDGDPCWTPLLSAALAAEQPWLHVHCPGCNTVRAVDLRVVPRPSDTALTAIAAKLRCQDPCRGQAGAPRIFAVTDAHHAMAGALPARPLTPRTFAMPWRAEQRGESWIVYDAIGNPLTYSYFEDAPQPGTNSKRMTGEDARRLAQAVTRLPDLLKRP
jgi:hypothetical protein